MLLCYDTLDASSVLNPVTTLNRCRVKPVFTCKTDTFTMFSERIIKMINEQDKEFIKQFANLLTINE